MKSRIYVVERDGEKLLAVRTGKRLRIGRRVDGPTYRFVVGRKRPWKGGPRTRCETNDKLKVTR